MNDIKVMNHAADNIRILSAAMVEKANSGLGEPWEVQTLLMYYSPNF